MRPSRHRPDRARPSPRRPTGAARRTGRSVCGRATPRQRQALMIAVDDGDRCPTLGVPDVQLARMGDDPFAVEEYRDGAGPAPAGLTSACRLRGPRSWCRPAPRPTIRRLSGENTASEGRSIRPATSSVVPPGVPFQIRMVLSRPTVTSRRHRMRIRPRRRHAHACAAPPRRPGAPGAKGAPFRRRTRSPPGSAVRSEGKRVAESLPSLVSADVLRSDGTNSTAGNQVRYGKYENLFNPGEHKPSAVRRE